MVIYSQKQFISDTVEGVLIQQCNFPIELVIGEDCSTDSTRPICEDYAQNYLKFIRILPSETNLGVMHDFIRTLTLALVSTSPFVKITTIGLIL